MISTVNVRTWYLQMLSPPLAESLHVPRHFSIVRAQNPTLSWYRFLYTQVGKDFSWYNRLIMFDDELEKIITDNRVEVWVLYLNGVPAGFTELDRRVENEIEVSYFGILPEFRGAGIGRFFLDWIIEKAWSYAPSRLWLHTCELDHVAALSLYVKSGFKQYEQKYTTQQIIPDKDKKPLLPFI